MEETALATHVHDPARLAALKAVALLDTPSEDSFDRLTWLATRFLKAPVSLVSLIDADRQFFKSCIGLPEPWLSKRETPLSHSFCQHNRVARQPLIVIDARRHPIFNHNPAIEELGVVAYLGIPLVTSDGYVLGSFCVIDSRPRDWIGEDVSVVEKLAAAAMTEIQLRTEIATRHRAEESLKNHNVVLSQAYRNLERETEDRLRALDQLRQRDYVLMQQSRLAAMGEVISNIAHQWRQPLNRLGLLAQELPMSVRLGTFTPDHLDTNVGKMMESIRHMSEVIDNFMSFFRPDREKVQFSIVEAVEKSLHLLEDTLAEAQITASVVRTSDPVVTGYRNEYSQVLLNVVNNAKDALVAQGTQGAAIVIEVGSEGERSVVTVTDNAGGIHESILDKIFDPYFSTKGVHEGSGIGLYLSKMIIEKHMGGSLDVTNVSGGAQFRIEL